MQVRCDVAMMMWWRVGGHDGGNLPSQITRVGAEGVRHLVSVLHPPIHAYAGRCAVPVAYMYAVRRFSFAKLKLGKVERVPQKSGFWDLDFWGLPRDEWLGHLESRRTFSLLFFPQKGCTGGELSVPWHPRPAADVCCWAVDHHRWMHRSSAVSLFFPHPRRKVQPQLVR